MGFAKFDSRKVYFAENGTKIENATNAENAIELAGLNYEVEKQKLYVQSPLRVVPNQFATVRTDNKEILGIVGKNYEILQNKEAFDFLDDVVGGGAKFETAGGYRGGRASFVTCTTEPIKIFDDDIQPYILAMNSFDGSGTVRVMFTPVRVFCSNCLVRAQKQASNIISIRHSKDVAARLTASKNILLSNTKYLEYLKEEAEKLASIPLNENEFVAMVKSMDEFNVKEDATYVVTQRNIEKFEAIMRAYRQDDLQNFNNTAYKAYQAMADYESHPPVFRKTENPDKSMQIVVAGMPLLNTFADQLLTMAH
jgi:phage/plasmid-like protein (TIGR03299 family)